MIGKKFNRVYEAYFKSSFHQNLEFGTTHKKTLRKIIKNNRDKFLIFVGLTLDFFHIIFE